MSALIVPSEKYFNVLLKQVETATSEIKCTVFCTFLNEEKNKRLTTQIFKALINAWARKLLVRVLINAKQEPAYISKGNKLLFESLQRAGVPARFYPDNVMLHSKLWVFDKSRVLLGSHNLSIQSFTSNVECSILLTDDKACVDALAFFDYHWDVACQGW